MFSDAYNTIQTNPLNPPLIRGTFFARLFAKEQSYRSMLRIPGY